MDLNEQCLIDVYRTLDRMKADIRDRCTELCGFAPSEERLALTCWQVWRLSNFYWDACQALSREPEEPPHAPYTPPELKGTHRERLRELNAKLAEVLGDSVDVGEAGAVDEDEEEDAFQPDHAELVMLVDYGQVIATYAEFLYRLAGLRIGDGPEQEYVQNVAMRDIYGPNTVMLAFLRAVTAA